MIWRAKPRRRNRPLVAEMDWSQNSASNAQFSAQREDIIRSSRGHPIAICERSLETPGVHAFVRQPTLRKSHPCAGSRPGCPRCRPCNHVVISISIKALCRESEYVGLSIRNPHRFDCRNDCPDRHQRRSAHDGRRGNDTAQRQKKLATFDQPTLPRASDKSCQERTATYCCALHPDRSRTTRSRW